MALFQSISLVSAKFWSGTKEYVSCVMFFNLRVPTKKRKNFVSVYFDTLLASFSLIKGPIAKNVSVHIVMGSPNTVLPIIRAGTGFPSCPAAPSALETKTFHLPKNFCARSSLVSYDFKNLSPLMPSKRPNTL